MKSLLQKHYRSFRAWKYSLAALAGVGVLAMLGAASAADYYSAPVVVTSHTVTEIVPCERVEREDPEADRGSEKITQECRDGKKEVRLITRKRAWNTLSVTRIGEEVTQEPVTEIRLVGIIDTTEEVVPEVIPCERLSRPDASLPKGTTRVSQECIDGSKSVTYKVRSRKGEVLSREAKSESITKNPQSEIKLIGTQEEDTCDPGYDPCIPYVFYDLDCPDIGMQVYVIGYDRHRLDRDGDGVGCEAY
jgi:uncharacterized protein YabE (DUF348 family)